MTFKKLYPIVTKRISSDDPEAIYKVKKEIERLEKEQVMMEKVNTVYQEIKKIIEALTRAESLGEALGEIIKTLKFSGLREKDLKFIMDFEHPFLAPQRPIPNCRLGIGKALIKINKKHLNFLKEKQFLNSEIDFENYLFQVFFKKIKNEP